MHTEPIHRFSAFRTWVKTALLTAAIMGAAWTVLFKAQFLLFNYYPLIRDIGFFLIFPGVLMFAPATLKSVHGEGYIVLAAVSNWLIYTQLIYSVAVWHRRKQRLNGAASPPEMNRESNYWDHWRGEKSDSR